MRQNIAEALEAAKTQPSGLPPANTGPPGAPGGPLPPGPPGGAPPMPPQGALPAQPPRAGGLAAVAKPGQTMPMQLAMNQAAPPFAAALQGPRGLEAQTNKPVGF